VIPLLSRRTRLLLELRPFDFFLLRKWWCHRVWPRIITVVIFPPAFFWIRAAHCILSLMLPLLCRGSMYSLSYGYLIFFDGEICAKRYVTPNHYCH
jgi:hypothetical protein